METTPTITTLSLMDTPDYWAHVQCSPSAPADALLAYINPFISAAQPGTGVIDLALSDLQVPLSKPSTARAAGILSLTAAKEPLPQKLRGLGLTLPSTPDTSRAFPIPFAVPATRFTIANENLTYDRMDLQFPPAPALTFSGSASLANGAVNLLLTAPTDSASPLSSGTIRLPITGTVTSPIIALPAH